MMVAARLLSARPENCFELAVVDLDPWRSTLLAIGEFDICARRALADGLQEQQDIGRRFVCLDLSKVVFMDCSCLGVLVAFHHSFLERRGLLILAGINPRVERLLTIARLQNCLFVAPDDQDPFSIVEVARGAIATSLAV